MPFCCFRWVLFEFGWWSSVFIRSPRRKIEFIFFQRDSWNGWSKPIFYCSGKGTLHMSWSIKFALNEKKRTTLGMFERRPFVLDVNMARVVSRIGCSWGVNTESKCVLRWPFYLDVWIAFDVKTNLKLYFIDYAFPSCALGEVGLKFIIFLRNQIWKKCFGLESSRVFCCSYALDRTIST